jgi:hypothetical protein
MTLRTPATVNNISLSRPRKMRKPTPFDSTANFRAMCARMREREAEKRCKRCLGKTWIGEGRCPCFNGGLSDWGVAGLTYLVARMHKREEDRKANLAAIKAEVARCAGLMALRRQEIGYRAIICEQCAQVFAAKHSQARFCSDKCRKAHKRAKTRPRRLPLFLTT